MTDHQQVVLGAEAGSYMLRQLLDGKSLGRQLAQRITYRGGVIRTYVRRSFADFGQFAWGGAASREATVPWLVDTMLATMRAHMPAVSIFENACASPTDPWLQRARSTLWYVGDEVYHFCTSLDRMALSTALIEAGDYPLIAAVGPLTVAATAEDASARIRAIAESAYMAVLSAYDGESYLVWSLSD